MKECFIALIQSDVLKDGGWHHLITLEIKLAQWLFLRLVIVQAVPALGVVEVMSG